MNISLVSVQQSLCDLFTKWYSGSFSTKKQKNCFFSFFVFANKRFFVASSNYWSSSTNVDNTSNAWNVNFNNGNDNNNDKSNSNYVRCVRDNEKVFYV